MKSSTRRLWKVSIDMKYLLILSVLVVIFSLFTQCHCDIQPIDVEAVKREQPDFEVSCNGYFNSHIFMTLFITIDVLLSNNFVYS